MPLLPIRPYYSHPLRWEIKNRDSMRQKQRSGPFESGKALAFAFAVGFLPWNVLYNPENPTATAIRKSNGTHSVSPTAHSHFLICHFLNFHFISVPPTHPRTTHGVVFQSRALNLFLGEYVTTVNQNWLV